MIYIKASIGLVAIALYTALVLKPFLSDIESLEKEVSVLKREKKNLIKGVDRCSKIRDVGTKRFIDFIDERIEEQEDEIVFRNQRETNSTLPSWSSAVLGLKGKHND